MSALLFYTQAVALLFIPLVSRDNNKVDIQKQQAWVPDQFLKGDRKDRRHYHTGPAGAAGP